MECYEGENKKVCLLIGREKCEALHIKAKKRDEMADEKNFASDPKYYDCMEQVFFDQYGEGNVEFCRYAFGKSSDVITKEQFWENAFEKQRFACYDQK